MPIHQTLVEKGEQGETAMPTVFRSGPYRFYFYSNERSEPPHVHVRRDNSFAKFWLRPIALAASKRLSSRKLRAVEGIFEEHRDNFLEAWDEHIGR
jgi:hypothetical protein